MSAGWLLGVDFGTSNTAAAHVDLANGTVRTLALSHGGNLMPSSVYVTSPAQIDVGDVAANKAAGDPSGYLAAPKRLLSAGQTNFTVGQWDLPGHAVVGGVLRTVLMRAQAQHQGLPPAGLVLTHPEDWSPAQIQVLTDAASGIGYPQQLVRTVSEPRAAAHYYTRTAGVRPGEHIAVFDFGGGTLDVAVLTSTPDGSFQVVAARGDNALGGRNFDAAVRRWVEEQLSDSNPALLNAVRLGGSMRDQRALEESIRAAKELLSEAPQASIDVSWGGQHDVLSLTRREFEQLISPEVDRAVELARATLQLAGNASAVQSIYLTGGSSRIPLVHQRMQSLGQIATLDDPKTVVAQGALIAARQAPNQQTAPMATPHIPQQPPMPNQSSGAHQFAPPPSQPSWEQPAQPAQQSWGQPPAQPGWDQPQQQQPYYLQQPPAKSSSMVGWLAIGGAVLVAAIVAVVVVINTRGEDSPGSSNTAADATTSSSASSGGGSGGSGTTPDKIETNTAENVKAAIPSVIRNAATSCDPKTNDSGVFREIKCTIPRTHSLYSGINRYTSLDPYVTASILTASDLESKLSYWRKKGSTELITDNSKIAIRNWGTDKSFLYYIDKKSGLYMDINGIKDGEGVKTFLSRSGLN